MLAIGPNLDDLREDRRLEFAKFRVIRVPQIRFRLNKHIEKTWKIAGTITVKFHEYPAGIHHAWMNALSSFFKRPVITPARVHEILWVNAANHDYWLLHKL
jgi:hypothetical protein